MKNARFTQDQNLGVLKVHQAGATAADLYCNLPMPTRSSSRLQRGQTPHQPQWHDARGFRSTGHQGVQHPTDSNTNGYRF